MRIIIMDIPKKHVRRFTTERESIFYAVTISVCRNLSSDGFVTFVCDDAHIDLEGYKYVLDFEEDSIRTFKITDRNGRYTTAQLYISQVAASHIDSVEERKAEREEAHRKELEQVLFDTKYYALHVHDAMGDKLLHSFKTIKEANEEIMRRVFAMLDSDLNNDVMHGEHGKYDVEILTDRGYLIIRRTTYKRNAFANRNNIPEYTFNECKETKYYIRNDKHMHNILWDWTEVLDAIDVRCTRNENILNEERTEEEWKKAKEIARNNARTGCHNVANLSKYWVEPKKPEELKQFVNTSVVPQVDLSTVFVQAPQNEDESDVADEPTPVPKAKSMEYQAFIESKRLTEQARKGINTAC